MIIGFVKLENGAVVTHRDSYLLSNLSVVSVRRPYLAMTVSLGGLLAGFAGVFSDLLYGHEMAWMVLICAGATILGSQIGELKFVSRDLRGSELSSVIYGHYGRLNRIRREITQALDTQAPGRSS